MVDLRQSASARSIPGNSARARLSPIRWSLVPSQVAYALHLLLLHGPRPSCGQPTAGAAPGPRKFELAIRAVPTASLTRGPSPNVDRMPMARVKERGQIERAGWFK